jgi:hypothetical protein
VRALDVDRVASWAFFALVLALAFVVALLA